VPVPIEFDKPRNLYYGLAEVRDLERVLDGKPVGSIITDLSLVGVNALVLALWAGLKHEDASLTTKLVERKLQTYIKDKKSLKVLGRAVRQALVDETGLFQTEEEAPEGNEQTAAAQT
jgi:hypothetical protein